MKNLLLIIGISFSFSAFNQSFHPSEKYSLKGLEREEVQAFVDEHYDDTTQHLYAYLSSSDYPAIDFMPIWIQWPELFDSYTLTEWENPGYENVERILKIEIDYAACCSDIHYHYFIQRNDGSWYALPTISWVGCDWPQDSEDYIFDAAGSNIGHAILSHDTDGNVIDTQIILSLYWDGEEAIAPH